MFLCIGFLFFWFTTEWNTPPRLSSRKRASKRRWKSKGRNNIRVKRRKVWASLCGCPFQRALSIEDQFANCGATSLLLGCRLGRCFCFRQRCPLDTRTLGEPTTSLQPKGWKCHSGLRTLKRCVTKMYAVPTHIRILKKTYNPKKKVIQCPIIPLHE